uniref:Uncharacterized protein n=1 Tax=Colobus angolensis palliatus TaxID=336983 RepID=A0A2K5IC48_COLAP
RKTLRSLFLETRSTVMANLVTTMEQRWCVNLPLLCFVCYTPFVHTKSYQMLSLKMGLTAYLGTFKLKK